MHSNQTRIRELHQQLERLRADDCLTVAAFDAIFTEVSALVIDPHRLEAIFVRAPAAWVDAHQPMLQSV